MGFGSRWRSILLSVALWSCLALLAGPAAALEKRPLPQELVSCINDGVDDQFTTYKDFAYKKPVRLKLHQGWWSAKPAAAPVTVVTGLNPNRLKQLESQCRRWHGPISAAVYVVLRAQKEGEPVPPEERRKLDDAMADVGSFHNKMEGLALGCQLDILLVYEVVLDDVMEVMFPVNALRNLALLQTRTDLLAMVDVDLLVSNSLFLWLQDASNYKSLREGTLNKKVYVLPAFETAPMANETRAHHLADAASGMRKDELSELVRKRVVYQFALYLFWQGHNSTDYRKWFETDTAYPIEFHDGYEPWFIIDRRANPFYDEAFRGYGWNKVTQVANILAQKYTFMAHPAGFLIHRQHGRSAADKMYQAQKKSYEADLKANRITKDRPNNNLAGLTHRFRDHVYEAIGKGGYQPLLDDSVKRCLATLDWWRDGQQQQQQGAEQGQQQQQQQEGEEAEQDEEGQQLAPRRLRLRLRSLAEAFEGALRRLFLRRRRFQ